MYKRQVRHIASGETFEEFVEERFPKIDFDDGQTVNESQPEKSMLPSGSALEISAQMCIRDRPSRGPGRRERGHGARAEKALLPVIPSVDECPYAIRVVSEVLSSNGSTSQGAVCGSTLALMAAGVPIKAPVAGISCGLITGDEGVYGDFITMVDIQGLEDFYGCLLYTSRCV